MSDSTASEPRLPTGFRILMAAQFVSALADNALLIVAMALLQTQGFAAWWAPLLKFSFTLSYVGLAPFVGPLADAVPKGRLMAAMNAVKVFGVVLIGSGIHPLLGYGLVGLGAAAYAPAKYGLVTELVAPRALVKANAWIEVSVVMAALLGVLVGGLLVSPASLSASTWLTAHLVWPESTASHAASLLILLLLYGSASALNLDVPRSGASYPRTRWQFGRLVKNFASANRQLWSDGLGGLSLLVTTLFWAVGATLQFAVLRWAEETLHLSLEHAAYLQAAVAIGVMAGAAWVGRSVSLERALYTLPAGIILGLLFATLANTESLTWALPLLLATGAVGGILVVPMNALLQHRGFALLSAGRSIAVQGYNENLGILLMLALYAALLAMDLPLRWVMTALGLSVAASMIAITRRATRLRRGLEPRPELREPGPSRTRSAR